MTFAAAYSQERNEQWTDVWPAVKNTVWHGDNVVVHCIKGRHRGAFLGILCRALLAGESIEDANHYVESRRDTELNKVIRDQGMRKWLHKTFQGHRGGNTAPRAAGICSYGEVQHPCHGRGRHHLVPAQAGRGEGEAPGEPIYVHGRL